MKKFLSFTLIGVLFNMAFSAFAAPKSSSTVKFLKGNISEKTQAVREASGEEGIVLSTKALEFALENKVYLGSDRELEGLVVSAILSIPDELFSDTQKSERFLNQFLEVFKSFSDSSTVQIAVLKKILLIKDKSDLRVFTALLNSYIQNANPNSDASVIKAVLEALEAIGNRESFVILYNHWNNKRFSAFSADIEKALISLSAISSNEIIQIIQSKDIAQICKVFALAQKNPKISKNLLCEISEISLAETILLVDSSSKFTSEVDVLQNQCLTILEENKWTRASTIAIEYLHYCKRMFDNGVIKEEYFARVITSMSEISPIESVNQLCALLEEFNSRKEKEEKVSETAVMAVINTLGAIGNKSAFDYLLAVTYLSYPDDVLSAAREALAGLRWQ